ncbi:TetR/AcrR family transcriptional regulator [Streptomyces sp. NPDC058653]|uniref:TetR/AcrR family transcriptional regulator n=1 Tax=Streptomyces sp. NPDC058653 TaxID=3346576 RepID=UPI0036464CAB
MQDDDGAPPATARRRDSAATRAAILQAARRLFVERGYDGAGVRDIAGAVGVDPRLIGRYFGSKEKLFAEVVGLAYQKSLMMTPELNGEAARALLIDADRSALEGLLLTLRSAANPQAAAIMRDIIENSYQHLLADALPGRQTDSRAALLVAICSGVLLTRMILGNTQLNGPEAEDLIPLLHKALDAVAMAPEPPTTA